MNQKNISYRDESAFTGDICVSDFVRWRRDLTPWKPLLNTVCFSKALRNASGNGSNTDMTVNAAVVVRYVRYTITKRKMVSTAPTSKSTPPIAYAFVFCSYPM